MAIKEIVRRAARNRGTAREAIRSNEPPRYERSVRLDPHHDQIARLLRDVDGITNIPIRALIEEVG